VRPGLPEGVPFSDDIAVLRLALARDKPYPRLYSFRVWTDEAGMDNGPERAWPFSESSGVAVFPRRAMLRDPLYSGANV